MSTPAPAAAAPHRRMKPDPKRPYKALAAALAAALATLLDLALPMPDWLTAVLAVVGAGAAAFVTKNPLVERTEKKRKRGKRRP